MAGRTLVILIGDVLIGLSFLILAMLIATFAVSVVSELATAPQTIQFVFSLLLFLEGLALQFKALRWEKPLAGLIVSALNLLTAVTGLVVGFILVARLGIDWWLAFLNEFIDVSRITLFAGVFLVIVLILVVAVAVATFEIPPASEDKEQKESKPAEKRRRTTGTLRRR